MKTNRYVSNKEYVLDESETIVSKTDIHGNITYINQDFIRISGFSRDELMGAPQNIVRHPDMPKAAFYDLWHTLRSGKAWTGLIKNRCKNGDHYWVEANAAPITEDGVITGYTSIRVQPSEEQKQTAERAYRTIREGSRAITIREGAIVRRSRFSREPQHPPRELSISSRLTLWCSVLIAIFFINAVIIWQAGLTKIADNPTLAIIGGTVAVIGILVTSAGGLLFYRTVLTPLARAQRSIDLMCAGDLSSRINATGNNEITAVAQSLRKLQINVKLLIGQIKESTMMVRTQSEYLATSNVRLTDRTQSQAAYVEQTAASVTQLASSFRQHAENSETATTLVASAAQAASRGAEAVIQVTETMQKIQESAHKIEDIISLIDGIAFQTNILALNAAVEAARAGYQGQGFAVVASEVRSLALRSADASSDIRKLIQDSVKRVSDGGQQVTHTAEIMRDILDSAQKASDIMNEIASAGHEQSVGVEHINQAIDQIETITQDNLNQVIDTERSAETLQDLARHLSDMVNQFKLVVADLTQERPRPSRRTVTPVLIASNQTT